MNQKFILAEYTVGTPAVIHPMKLLLVGDLHMNDYGDQNREILDACFEAAPDAVMCTGDMINGSHPDETDTAVHFLRRLTEAAPVYAVNGNHETMVRDVPEAYRTYMRALAKSGVQVLNNRTYHVEIVGNPVSVTGIELPRSCYKKFRRHGISEKALEKMIGTGPEQGTFSVLLAHNPYFADSYFSWGADLILSGHNHGGVMRLGDTKSLLSPYGYPLPKYGYGHFQKDDKHLIITSGLGEHTIPMRIHNPLEAVLITVTPAAEPGETETTD